MLRGAFSGGTSTVVPKQLGLTLQVGTHSRHVCFTPTAQTDSEHHFWWDALSSTGAKVKSGIYNYSMTLESLFDGVNENTGQPNGVDARREVKVAGSFGINNREASPFGSGWWLQGLSELHVNPGGDVLLTDADGVELFSSGYGIGLMAGSLTQSGFAGDEGLALQARHSEPGGFAVGPGGVLLFSDRDNHRIRSIDAFGTIRTFAGRGSAGYAGDNGPALQAAFRQPTHLASDAVGNIFVLDFGNQVVRRIDAATSLVTTVVPSFEDGVITSLAASPAGDLFVSESESGVWKYPADGSASVHVLSSSQVSRPIAVAYDPKRRVLYVASEANDHIYKVDRCGIVDVFAGGGDFQEAGPVPATRSLLEFNLGSQLVLDQNGTLFVSCGDNGALIQRITKDGIMTRIAGRPSTGHAFDGSGTQESTRTFPIPSFEDFVTAIGVQANGDVVFGVTGSGSYIGFMSHTIAGHSFYISPRGETAELSGTLTGYQIKNVDQAIDTYDVTGRIVEARSTSTCSCSSPAADSTRYRYSADGLVTEIIDRAGLVTTLAYDGGKLTTITDPAGRITLFTINGNGDLASVELPDHAIWSYQYDHHLLTTETSPRGSETRMEYGSDQMIRALVEPDGGRKTFVPSDSLHLLNGVATAGCTDPQAGALVLESAYQDSYTDPAGALVRYTTNPEGKPLTMTDALGRTTSWTLNGDGLPTLIRTPDGKQTVQIWDENGNQTDSVETIPAVTGPLLLQRPKTHTRATQYHPVLNQPTRVEDDGLVTIMAYNSEGRIIATTDAMGGTTRNVYTDDLLTSRTDQLGHTTSFGYDARGNRTSTTDAAGGVRTAEFDAAGNIILTVDTLSRATTFEYDAMGREVRRTNAKGGSSSRSYDGEGNLLTETDENGHTTTHIYDSRNRRIKTTDALGHEQRWEFDTAGRLRASVDPMGRRTEYEYDVVGRRIKETYPGGFAYQTTYDIADRPSVSTDPEGRTRKQFWNAQGLLVGELDGAGVLVVEHTYTPRGLLEFSRDAFGVTTERSYDDLNRETQFTVRSAPGSPPVQIVETTTYDRAGQVVKRTNSAGVDTTFEYDALGRVVKQTVASPPNDIVTRQIYDSEGRRIQLMLRGALHPGVRCKLSPGHSVPRSARRGGNPGTLYGLVA